MAGISRNKVKIWIVPTDTNPALLEQTGSGTYAPILGEIENYSKSGGENDTETKPVFGGDQTLDKPRGQVELSFDLIPDLDYVGRFENFAYGKNSQNVWVYSQDPTAKCVFIQSADGSKYGSYGFNNCDVISFDFDHSADDNRSGTFSLKFSPVTPSGVSNLQFNTVIASSLTAWTSLVA
jgi:hypothetical protein